MPSRSRVTGAFLVVLAAMLLTAAPAHSAPTLTPCTGSAKLPGARCGMVQVPLDRGNPGLGTTDIVFALISRRDPATPSEGTVLFNPGGPGNAPIAQAAGLAEKFAPLLESRDLLLVDPRGTGRSGALACATLRLEDVLAPPGDLLEALGKCGRTLGPRVGLYGSAAVADDFDAVRAALGLDRLDLWGESYGTYLMPVYAARHPEHVRSIVLSGAYPLAFDPWGLDRLGAARRAIRLVCARAPGCRGAAVLRDIGHLAARLRRNPSVITVTAGEQRVRSRIDEGSLASVLYTGGDADALYGRIPAAVRGALAGDRAVLRRMVETRLLTLGALFGNPAFGEFFSPTQSLATQCHDYPRVFSLADPPAARRAAYLKARRALDPRAFAPFSPAGWTAAGFEAVDTCLTWPDDRTAAPPVAPGTPMPDAPVLVLSGDLDANTPSLAGRQAAAQFPRSNWVEIPNVGHTPAGNSPCALALGQRFVATLAVNPRACDGTGTPSPIAARAPVRAAGLPLVRGNATRAQRRALALVVATVADLDEQSGLLELWAGARGLRGGRYVAARGGRVRLEDATVVRDASLSGLLTPGTRGISGPVRLRGPGVLAGRLRIRLTARGDGRAAGVLGGRPVRIAFTFPS
jgi:pimeloyl-ACP methyl ester carboxylesterase